MTLDKIIEKSVLDLFCKKNANSITYCGWKDTQYCQKSCKYFKEKDEDKLNGIYKK